MGPGALHGSGMKGWPRGTGVDSGEPGGAPSSACQLAASFLPHQPDPSCPTSLMHPNLFQAFAPTVPHPQDTHWTNKEAGN